MTYQARLAENRFARAAAVACKGQPVAVLHEVARQLARPATAGMHEQALVGVAVRIVATFERLQQEKA